MIMSQHVTFARMKVQPGKLDELTKLMDENPARLTDKGWTSTIVGKTKDDPDTLWLCVTWDNSDRYYANAGNPEQNAQYERMRALLAADPEWFDCDVVEEQSA
jgi:quinol monooxygenase YgiN